MVPKTCDNMLLYIIFSPAFILRISFLTLSDSCIALKPGEFQKFVHSITIILDESAWQILPKAVPQFPENVILSFK